MHGGDDRPGGQNVVGANLLLSPSDRHCINYRPKLVKVIHGFTELSITVFCKSEVSHVYVITTITTPTHELHHNNNEYHYSMVIIMFPISIVN